MIKAVPRRFRAAPVQTPWTVVSLRDLVGLTSLPPYFLQEEKQAFYFTRSLKR